MTGFKTCFASPDSSARAHQPQQKRYFTPCRSGPIKPQCSLRLMDFIPDRKRSSAAAGLRLIRTI
jgi:hypothetical protein